MRMADEVDAAQGRGEVAANGQHGEAVHTSDSLGIDRRRLSEWREVRDAGEGRPAPQNAVPVRDMHGEALPGSDKS